LFTDPIPRPDELRSIYTQSRWNPGDRYDKNSTLASSQFRFIQQSLNSLGIHSVGKILDIGCSNGRLLNLFQVAGWNVTGVEPNNEAVNYAKNKFKIDISPGTFAEVTYPNDEFDLVCLSHVFEHFDDPISTLQEIKRIAKRRGLVFVEVPNDTKIGRKGQTGYHLFFFSPQTLSALFEKCGFESVRLVTNGRLLDDYQKLDRLVNSAPAMILQKFPLLVKLVKRTMGDLLVDNDHLDDYYQATQVKQGATIRGFFTTIAE
jgi:SAM-dependent methyltransferase